MAQTRTAVLNLLKPVRSLFVRGRLLDDNLELIDAAVGALQEASVTQADVDAAVAALIAGAPGALNTLDELAAALNDDASFAASVTTALAGKVAKTLYDANTILKADTDDTPAALTMGASTILARLAAGSIKAATPAEIKTLLAIAEADVTGLVADLAAKVPKAGETIRLPPGRFGGIFNSPTRGNASNVWDIWSFVNGADRRMATFEVLPDYWATYHLDIFWANASAASGNVHWRYLSGPAGDGDSEATAHTVANSAVTAAGAQDVVKKTRIAADQAAPAAGKALSVCVNRFGLGTGTADTLAGAVNFLGAVLTRAS